MAHVVDLLAKDTLDDAWEAHRKLASKLLSNPKLLVDRDFMTRLKRAENKFARILNMQDGQ